MILTYILTILGFLLLTLIFLFIKKLQDRDKVRIILVYPNNQVKIGKIKPDGNTITFDKKSFNFNEKDTVFYKGMPTYFFNYENTIPFNPYTDKLTEYTPKDFNTALKSKAVQDIVTSSTKGVLDSSTIAILFGIITIAALGIVAYLGNEKIIAMQEQIQQIINALDSIGLGDGTNG